ncbi:MAG TPA: glycosyltransferase family 2 protein [Kofleriaceae bacterium]|nr:glycosyltransferase family 2 protein [Kofleriaceae bacterium]
MKLSFVIPTRNQARFLAQCIDGCFAQNVADSEVLVVDGASTDDTRDVLKSYGDKVRWTSEPDRGQSDAINKGVGRAQGELIAWINSDDYYASPRAIRALLDAFEAEPDVDIAFGNGVRVDEAGRELGPYRARPYGKLADIVTHPASFVLQPAVVFRRELFLDVGGVDESLHYTMDYELWLRMFVAARRARYIPEVIACARYHSDAKSVAAMGKQIRELYGVKRRGADDLDLGVVDRLLMHAGMATLGMYWAAARLNLIRAA